MKKALVILGALVFLAAGKEPTVRVENSATLFIGSTKITLPLNLAVFQDSKTGDVNLQFEPNGQCNKDTEKMIGIDWAGRPICVPEGTAAFTK